MLISLKSEYIWSDRLSRHILLRQKSINWTGPVLYMKGASQQQTDLANSQANFYNTMTKDYNTQFANQSAILSSLRNSLSPVLSGGINQYGFSTPEENALTSTAIQSNAQAARNVSQALRENQVAAGGGNVLLPTGAQEAQKGALAQQSADALSNSLLGIKQAGYQQGRQNYLSAVNALGGVASQYDPTAFAGQATGAGNAAFGSATEVNKENAAASPWNLVGGILGGAVGAGLDAFTGGIGGSLASGLFGGGSGGGGNTTIAPTGVFAQQV